MAVQYKVVKGDTLSEIAYKHYKTYGYSSWKTYQDYLAKINNISNPDLIYIGQVIKLNGSATSTSSTSSTATKVTIQHFGLQAKTDNTLFVTWAFNGSNTDKYEVEWDYYTSNNIWFTGSHTSVTHPERQSLYSYPSNAEKVRVRIKPVSKTYTKNNKTTSYWTGKWSDYKYYDVGTDAPLPAPERTTVSVSYKLHYLEGVAASHGPERYPILFCTVGQYDPGDAKKVNGEHLRIHFQIYQIGSGGKKTWDRYADVKFDENMWKIPSSVTLGDYYNIHLQADCQYCAKSRAEYYKLGPVTSNGVIIQGQPIVTRYSEWTEISNTVTTAASTPNNVKVTQIKPVTGETNKFDVHLEWGGVSSATSYNIEYACDKGYFDSGANVFTATNEYPYCIIAGIEGDKTWYFRVQAVSENGESGWTVPVSANFGVKPSQPTTWSSTTRISTGDKVTLYWMHNTDGSSEQKNAQIKLIINGIEQEIITIKDAERLKASSYVLDTTTFNATLEDGTTVKLSDMPGATIIWSVRTAGVLLTSNGEPEYGEYSATRTIDVYSPPVIDMHVTNQNGDPIEVVKSFPIHVNVEAGPKAQTPIMYYLTVISNDTYETVDNAGNTKMIRAGDSVYSAHIDPTSDSFTDLYKFVSILSADNIDLENGINYTIACSVTMNSGLVGSGSRNISVSWDEMYYEPNAEISVDRNTYVAAIRPYCGRMPYYKVEYNSETHEYTKTDELITPVEGEEVGALGVTSKVPFPLNDFDITFKEGASAEISGGDLTNVDGSSLTIDVNGYYNLEFTLYGNCIMEIGNMVYYGPKYWDSDEESYTDTISGTIQSIKISGFDEARVSFSMFVSEKTDEIVYNSTDGNDTLFYIGTESVLDQDVTLSVYRRDFDGSFTEIASEIENTGTMYVMDPHPALDSAKYRIVARAGSTGSISYYDIPDYEIGGKEIVIQWEESWDGYYTDGENEQAGYSWSGSMVKLPYNIDVADSYNKDVSLVNYIGRKRPVAYYGTQLGETSVWNTEIPSYDTVTLNMLRRLSIYTDKVYVREPSGSGYWADVKISFNQTHCEVTIPVTINITRVEGGV